MTFEGHHSRGHRPERIAEEIRNEVSLMLAGELKDPRLAVPLSVTEVRLTPDMRTVRVFVRLEGDRGRTRRRARGIEGGRGYVRHELVERLQLAARARKLCSWSTSPKNTASTSTIFCAK